MPVPATVLVVCTANICRSPMGAGLLEHALAAQPEPLRSIKVISAGVAARPGERVSENSIIALRKAGIDIAQHRSSILTPDMIRRALAVLCMTESHRDLIQLQTKCDGDNLFLFREFMPNGADREIADPFGGPLRVYETARDEMVEAIPSMIEFLRGRVNEVRKRNGK